MSKNQKFTAAYIPFAVGTFHLETAQALFDESKSLLRSIDRSVITPDSLLLSLSDLRSFLDSIEDTLDFLIVQNLTFANAAYSYEVLRRFGAPIVLWTLREAGANGGRLHLNSLTGAFSAANAIHSFRANFLHPLEFVFGNPDETAVVDFLKQAFSTSRLVTELRHTKIAAVGHAPEGFGFGEANEKELATAFGAQLVKIEARELMKKACSYSDDEIASYYERVRSQILGLEHHPEKNVTDFVRLYKAYSDFVRENGISALSSRCWPDFFTDYGTPVCAVLSLLNAEGISASCEGDSWGALSMFIASYFSKKTAFFGDPVSLDEKENTITFWHCGMASCSLARKDTGPESGVHPNRKIGPTMEFGCEAAEKATVFRIGKDANGTFRFFALKGAILDKPRQFLGTTLVFRPLGNAREIVGRAVEAGWEPHFVVAYGDISREIELLAHFLNIPLAAF